MHSPLLGILMLLMAPFVAPQVPNDSCTTEPIDNTTILLDTYKLKEHLPSWWTTLPISGNETWSNTSHVCGPAVQTCGFNSSNLLITQFINSTNPISKDEYEVSVFVEYEKNTNCTNAEENSNQCTTNFSLWIYQAATEDSDKSMNISNYVQVTNIVGNNQRIPIRIIPSGFYLAFQHDMDTCVVINRVRVLYTTCPDEIRNFVEYSEALSGQNRTGECGINSMIDGNTLARCPFNATFELPSPGRCNCDPGYTRNQDQCNVCAMNYFNISSACVMCPSDSTSLGGMATECTCNSGRSTMDGADSTNQINVGCDYCQVDYRQENNRNCVKCPGNSSREFMSLPLSLCFCNDNRATSTNARNTTDSNCDGCAINFFLSGNGACTRCPNNSISENHDDTHCTCAAGSTVTNGTETRTTTKPCLGCAASYYRRSPNSACISCPANSVRTLTTDDDSICHCKENFKRYSSVPTQDCVPTAGFVNNSYMLSEGTTISVPLQLSARNGMIGVPIALIRQSGPSRTISKSDDVSFDEDLMTNLMIMSADNDVSLEENTVVELMITGGEHLPFIAGGDVGNKEVFNSTRITIQDDDFVQVGFTMGEVSFNESEKDPSISITRLQPIGSDLQLQITGAESPLVIDSSSITFSKDGSNATTIEFSITDDFVGNENDKKIVLQLEYTGSPQFSNSVDIGGGSTYGSITITILDDDPSPPPTEFPLVAIIGVCAGGAGLAVLFLIIVILCLCICRLRVNRQGFYPTYEDKTSEPPAMLRYSASLRSISSQTVIPVTEGRSIPKENEFYV